MNPSIDETATLYLLGELEPVERAAFEAQLERDPALAERLRALEVELEARVRALPQFTPPPGSLARIEARIDAPGVAGRARNRAAPGGSWFAWAKWGLAAVAVLGIGTIAVQEIRRGVAPRVIVVGLGTDRSATAEVALRAAGAADADGRFVQLAALAERFWEKPGDLPVTLVADGQPRAYAVFDPGSNEGFLGVRQLQQAPGDRRYHLWIVDTQTRRARDAGILPVGGDGRGLFSFSLAPGEAGPAGRMAFFVTAEDGTAAAGGQPHGQVVLGDRRL